MILNGFSKTHFSEYVCGTRDPPPFKEKSILNFHFDYWIISLSATSNSDGTFCYIYIKDYQNTAHGILPFLCYTSLKIEIYDMEGKTFRRIRILLSQH